MKEFFEARDLSSGLYFFCNAWTSTLYFENVWLSRFNGETVQCPEAKEIT